MIINQIFIYPLKSASGLNCEATDLESRGLVNDRLWMLIDPQGRFISQREHPTMALLTVQVDTRSLSISAPGLETIKAPRGGNGQVKTQLWGKDVAAEFCSHEADASLSAHLGTAVRLVYMPRHLKRGVNPVNSQAGDHVSFADGYPLLLLGQGSLEDLNTRLETSVDMRRFRPNLVVSRVVPFAEDNWKRIRIGHAEFDLVKPCPRCIMTTVNPDTGQKESGDPLKTLAGYRREGNNINFGQNMIPRKLAPIHVGDKLEVLEYINKPKNTDLDFH